MVNEVMHVLETDAAQQNDVAMFAGLPARLTLIEDRSPEKSMKIPGVIRQVKESGLLVDLWFPLLSPRIGEPAVLEVFGEDSLIQCFTIIVRSANPQSLELSLPLQPYMVQRRGWPRRAVLIPASLASSEAPHTEQTATLVNISKAGCAAVLAAPVPVGTTATLRPASGHGLPDTMHARVVRCSPMPSPIGSWEAGLAFLG